MLLVYNNPTTCKIQKTARKRTTLLFLKFLIISNQSPLNNHENAIIDIKGIANLMLIGIKKTKANNK